MAWTIRFEPRALKDLKKLDRSAQGRIVRFLQDRIAGEHDPRDLGKPLTGDRVGLWRYRAGQYRVICQIQDDVLTVLVLVVRIGHRKDVYR